MSGNLAPCRECGAPGQKEVFEAENVHAELWMCSKHEKLGGGCPSDTAYLSEEAWNGGPTHSEDDVERVARALFIRDQQAKTEWTLADIEAEWAKRKVCTTDRVAAAYRNEAETAIAALSTMNGEADFQTGVDEWMDACFGVIIKTDQLERADRFTEEALELAQTMPGFTADRAHALVDYVFGRDVGERHQEVGGVMVTLAALCNAVGIRIDHEAHNELLRVWGKINKIRAKQAAKPTGSALPQALDRNQA